MRTKFHTVADVVVIVSLALAGVVWAVRLEGRVSSNRETSDQAIQQIKESSRENTERIREDLLYIRRRVDELAVPVRSPADLDSRRSRGLY